MNRELTIRENCWIVTALVSQFVVAVSYYALEAPSMLPGNWDFGDDTITFDWFQFPECHEVLNWKDRARQEIKRNLLFGRMAKKYVDSFILHLWCRKYWAVSSEPYVNNLNKVNEMADDRSADCSARGEKDYVQVQVYPRAHSVQTRRQDCAPLGAWTTASRSSSFHHKR